MTEYWFYTEHASDSDNTLHGTLSKIGGKGSNLTLVLKKDYDRLVEALEQEKKKNTNYTDILKASIQSQKEALELLEYLKQKINGNKQK